MESKEDAESTSAHADTQTANEQQDKDALGTDQRGKTEEGNKEDDTPPSMTKLSEEEFLKSLTEDVRSQAEKQASKNIKMSEKEKKQKYRSLASQFKAREPLELAKAALEVDADDDFFRNGGGAGQYLKLLLHKDDDVVQAALTGLLRQLAHSEEEKQTIAFNDGLEGTSLALQICNVVDAVAILRAAEEGTKWNGTEIFVRHFFSPRPFIAILALRCYRIILNSVVTGLPVYSSIRWKWLSVLLTAGDPITKLLQVVAAGVASEKSAAWNAWASQTWQHASKNEPLSPMSFPAKELKQMECPCVVPMSPEAVMEATKCIYLSVTEVFSPLRRPREASLPVDHSNCTIEELIPPSMVPQDLNNSDMETAVINALNAESGSNDDVAPFTKASEETASQLTTDQIRRHQLRADRSEYLGSSKNVYGTTYVGPGVDDRRIPSSIFTDLVPWHPLRMAMRKTLSQNIRVNLNTGSLQRNGIIANTKYYGGTASSVAQAFSTWCFRGMDLLTMLPRYRILPPLHGIAALSTSKDYSWCLNESTEAYTESRGAHPLLPVANSKSSNALKELSSTKTASFLENVAVIEHRRCVNIETVTQCLGWRILDCLSLHEDNRPPLYDAGVWCMVSSSIERVKEHLLRVCVELQRVYIAEQLQEVDNTAERESEHDGGIQSPVQGLVPEDSERSLLNNAIEVLTRQKLGSVDLEVELSSIMQSVPKKPRFSRAWKLIEVLISGIVSMLETSYHLCQFCSPSSLLSVIQSTQPAERSPVEAIESAVWDDSVKTETPEEERTSSAGSGKKGKSRNSSSKKNKRRESVSGLGEETASVAVAATSNHSKYWDFLLSRPPCEAQDLENSFIKLVCSIVGVPFHYLFDDLISVSLGTLRGIFLPLEDEASAESRRVVAAGECKVLSGLLRLLRNPQVGNTLRDQAECTFYSLILDKERTGTSEQHPTVPPYRFPRELWKQSKTRTHVDVYNKLLQFFPQDCTEEGGQSFGETLGDCILYEDLKRYTQSKDYNTCTCLLNHVADTYQWCQTENSDTWLSLRELISVLCLWQEEPVYEFFGGGFERYRKTGLLSESMVDGEEQRQLGAKMCSLLKEVSGELGSEQGWDDQAEEDPLMQWSMLLPGSENLLASLSLVGTTEEFGSENVDSKEIYLNNVGSLVSLLNGVACCQKSGAVYNPLAVWGCFIMGSGLTDSSDLISSFQEAPEENHDLFLSVDSEEVSLYSYHCWHTLYAELSDCHNYVTTSNYVSERVVTPAMSLTTTTMEKGKKGKEPKSQGKKGKSEKSLSILEELSGLSRMFQKEHFNEGSKYDSLHRITRLIDRISAPVEKSPQTNVPPEFLTGSHVSGLVGRYGIAGLLCQAPIKYAKHCMKHDNKEETQLERLTVYSLRTLRKVLLTSPIEPAVLGSLGASVVDCLVVLAAPPGGIDRGSGENAPDLLWSPACPKNIRPVEISLEDLIVGGFSSRNGDEGSALCTDIRTQAMETLACICHAENLWRYQLPQQITVFGDHGTVGWETLWSELPVSNGEDTTKADKKGSKKGEKNSKGDDTSFKREGFSWSPGHRAGMHVAKHLLYLLAVYSNTETLRTMGCEWSDTLLTTLSAMLQVRGCRAASLNWLTSALGRPWLNQVATICEEATNLALDLFPSVEQNDEGSLKWSSRLIKLAGGFSSLEQTETEEELLREALNKAQYWREGVRQLVENTCDTLLPSQLSDFVPSGVHPLQSFDYPSFDLDVSTTPLAPAELSMAVRGLVGASPAPTKKGDEKKKPHSSDEDSSVPEIPEQQLASYLGLNFRSWFGADSQHLSSTPQRDLWWVFGESPHAFDTDMWKSSYEKIKGLINLDIESKRQGCLSPAVSSGGGSTKQNKGRKGCQSGIQEEAVPSEKDGCTKLFEDVVTDVCDSLLIFQFLLRILDATTSPSSLEHYIHQEYSQLKQDKNDEVSAFIADVGKRGSDIDQFWRECFAEHPSLPDLVPDSIFSMFAEGSSGKTGSKEKKKASPRSKDKDTKGDTSSKTESEKTFLFAKAPSWRSFSPLAFPKIVSSPLNKSFMHEALRCVAVPGEHELRKESWSQDHLRLPRSCCQEREHPSEGHRPPLEEFLLKRDIPVISFARLLEASRCSIYGDLIRTLFYAPLTGISSSQLVPLSATPSRSEDNDMRLYTYPLRQKFKCAASIVRGCTTDNEERLSQQSMLTNMFCAEALRSGSLQNILSWLDDFVKASQESDNGTSLMPCELEELYRILNYVIRRPLFISEDTVMKQSWIAHWSLLLRGKHPCHRYIHTSFGESTTNLEIPCLPLLHLVSSLCTNRPCEWILGDSFLHKGQLVYRQGVSTLEKQFQVGLSNECSSDTPDSSAPEINPFSLDLDCQDDAGKTPAMVSFIYGHTVRAFSFLCAGCNPNAQCESGDSLLKYALCSPSRSAVEDLVSQMELAGRFLCSPFPTSSIFDVPRTFPLMNAFTEEDSVLQWDPDKADGTMEEIGTRLIEAGEQSLLSFAVLLAYGASPTLQDARGNHCLHWLAAHCSLLCNWKSVNVILSPRLDAECRKNMTEIVIEMWGKDSVDKVNFLGETPLHCALAQGNVSMARRLLDLGAHPNVVDDHGNLPLHYAALGRDQESPLGEQSAGILDVLTRLLNDGNNTAIQIGRNGETAQAASEKSLEGKIGDTMKRHSYPTSLHELKRECRELLWYDNDCGVAPMQILAGLGIAGHQFHRLGLRLDSQRTVSIPDIPCKIGAASVSEKCKMTSSVMSRCSSAWSTASGWSCCPIPIPINTGSLQQGCQSYSLSVFKHLGCSTIGDTVRNTYTITVAAESLRRQVALAYALSSYSLASGKLVHACISSWCDINHYTSNGESVQEVEETITESKNPYVTEKVLLHSTKRNDQRADEGGLAARIRPVYPHCDNEALSYHQRLLRKADHLLERVAEWTGSTDALEAISMWKRSKRLTLDIILQHSKNDLLAKFFSYVVDAPTTDGDFNRICLLPLSVGILLSSQFSHRVSAVSPEDACWYLLHKDRNCILGYSYDQEDQLFTANVSDPYRYMVSPVPVEVTYPTPLQLTAFCNSSLELLAFILKQQLCLEDSVAVKCYNTRAALLDDFSRGNVEILADMEDDEDNEGRNSSPTVSKAFVRAELQSLESDVESAEVANIPWPDPRWDERMPIPVKIWTFFNSSPQNIDNLQEVARMNGFEEQVKFYESLPPLHTPTQ
eukprot:gb/GECG01015928.1/.p1 GENE.gb/GECG01015928.1/~~gb/GECG01015928.1/.p1  ORF type:complete len:3199 (+),score=376.81 gb/GECG01015928.1/:1-9597(+)